MPDSCCLCTATAANCPKATFHLVPKKKGVYNMAWFDILTNYGVCIKRTTKVCSLHFEKNCFEERVSNTLKKRIHLRDGAIPTIFFDTKKRRKISNVKQMNKSKTTVIYESNNLNNLVGLNTFINILPKENPPVLSSIILCDFNIDNFEKLIDANRNIYIQKNVGIDKEIQVDEALINKSNIEFNAVSNKLPDSSSPQVFEIVTDNLSTENLSTENYTTNSNMSYIVCVDDTMLDPQNSDKLSTNSHQPVCIDNGENSTDISKICFQNEFQENACNEVFSYTDDTYILNDSFCTNNAEKSIICVNNSICCIQEPRRDAENSCLENTDNIVDLVHTNDPVCMEDIENLNDETCQNSNNKYCLNDNFLDLKKSCVKENYTKDESFFENQSSLLNNFNQFENIQHSNAQLKDIKECIVLLEKIQLDNSRTNVIYEHGSLVWGKFSGSWYPAIIVRETDVGYSLSSPNNVFLIWIDGLLHNEVNKVNSVKYFWDFSDTILDYNKRKKINKSSNCSKSLLKILKLVCNIISLDIPEQPKVQWMRNIFHMHKSKLRNIRFFPYPEEVKCSLEKISNNTQNAKK